MKGHEYADLIAMYLLKNYEHRGINVSREVFAGKSIIGKDRRLDLFVFHHEQNKAFAIECKYQGTSGTTDEKLVYSLKDLENMWMSGCLVYAGEGFSKGVLSHLEGSRNAAYCLPDQGLNPTKQTRQLDHIIAMHFNFWDVIINTAQRSIFEA